MLSVQASLGATEQEIFSEKSSSSSVPLIIFSILFYLTACIYTFISSEDFPFFFGSAYKGAQGYMCKAFAQSLSFWQKQDLLGCNHDWGVGKLSNCSLLVMSATSATPKLTTCSGRSSIMENKLKRAPGLRIVATFLRIFCSFLVFFFLKPKLSLLPNLTSLEMLLNSKASYWRGDFPVWLKRMISLLFSFHWQLLWQEILDFVLCNCTETLSWVSSKNCLTLNYCLLKSEL